MVGTEPAGNPTTPRSPEALAEVIGELTRAAHAVDRRLRRRTWVVALALLAVFVIGQVRSEIQQRQIRGTQRVQAETQRVQAEQQRQIQSNAHRIEVLVYGACQTRNEVAKRQAKLIDSAIAAEKRKPAPDVKRIHDLEQFRPSVESCGRPPSS